jgi:hypothetical protein
MAANPQPYLLGLQVSHMDTTHGFRVVQGVNPKGEKVLVIWRNVAEKPNMTSTTSPCSWSSP